MLDTRLSVRGLTLLLFVTYLPGQCFAQAAPRIKNLSLRGLQTGTTSTLVIEGSNLLPEPTIILPIFDLKTTLKPDAKPNRLEVEFTLPADVPPGIYPLRVANTSGISEALLVGIDHLPQLSLTETVEALPVALHGRVGGPLVVKTAFPGKAGQRVVIDVETRRLGGDISPMLHLYNPRGVQLAWAQGRDSLNGDARIETTLTADGLYRVELHEALFKGGPQNFYRLKIGDFQFADLAHPLAVSHAQPVQVAFTSFTHQVDFPAPLDPRGSHHTAFVPLPAAKNFSGPAPRVFVSEFPEVVENPTADPQTVVGKPPLGLNGRLATKGEEDRFLIEVQPGQKLRLEVYAQRAGSPLDAVLTVRNAQGGQLATNDDNQNLPDPQLDFTVPAKMDRLQVSLRDLVGRAGPECLYRIVVTPVDYPDFSLQLLHDTAFAPQNGTAMLRVRATRRNFNGPITLSIPGLPPNISLSGAEIPAGATDALLTLTASADAPLQQWVTQIAGHATQGDVKLSRAAGTSAFAGLSLQPWLQQELPASIVTALPLSVVWSTPPAQLWLGLQEVPQVEVKRAAGTAGEVKLTLLTSQIVPTKKEANKDVEDLARAIRLAGEVQLAADAARGVVPINIPADLPLLAYDLVVQADLLDPTGKNVVATAYTPSARALSVIPLQVKLTSEPKITALAGAGETGVLSGQLQRAAGLTRPVTLTLTGLPPDLPPPTLEIPADQTEFRFPITFPFGAPAGELKGVKLVALIEQAGREFSTPGVDISLALAAGQPTPPAGPLVRLFEDEAWFVGVLKDGDGKAELDRLEPYSGKAALKVTPGQKYRDNLPYWSFKIKEKPGPGEFRYLRFAWKKKGGNNLLLQLHANGRFGPLAGEAGPAFRYEAGTTHPGKLSVLSLAPQPPEQWELITRDLFADFGEFTLTGLSFSPTNGEAGWLDHVYLSRSQDDFVPPKP